MRSHLFSACLLALATLAPTVRAQDHADAPVGRAVGYAFDSGSLSNPTPSRRVVVSRIVRVAGSAWLRLYFADAVLPPGSLLRVTSLVDHEVQVLDAESLGEWGGSTAYFNGEAVLLELEAAPKSTGNRVAMRSIVAEPGTVQARGGSGQCGICTVDERTPSAQAWSGRVMPSGCTASIFCEDSTLVSAGHCIQANLVVQFNVPASQASCASVNPPVADQFPVVAVQAQNSGIGGDWSVLRTGLNSLQQSPYQRQQALKRMAGGPADAGDNGSIWGYGLDLTCTRSQTQQFSPGAIALRGADFYRFNNDIRSGNSGSAYIVRDRIVGVVTHCNTICTNVATRHDQYSFAQAWRAMALCDDSYTISVQSAGADAVPIGADSSSAGVIPISTPASLTAPHFTTLTLDAPEAVGNACFVRWTLNGAPVDSRILTFSVTGAATAIAEYAPCCSCDLDRNGSVDSTDFFSFLGQFFTGAMDYDHDGSVGSGDFFAFLSCFFAGC